MLTNLQSSLGSLQFVLFFKNLFILEIEKERGKESKADSLQNADPNTGTWSHDPWDHNLSRNHKLDTQSQLSYLDTPWIFTIIKDTGRAKTIIIKLVILPIIPHLVLWALWIKWDLFSWLNFGTPGSYRLQTLIIILF